MVNVLYFPEYTDQFFRIMFNKPVVQTHGPEKVVRILSMGFSEFGKLLIHAAMHFGNGLIIVIEHNDQVGTHFADSIQPFQRFAAAHGSVADDGDDIFMRLFQVSGFGQSGGQGEGSGCMTYVKKVMFTFIRIGISGDIVIMFRGQVGLTASGQHFVRVALMGYIKYNLVFR